MMGSVNNKVMLLRAKPQRPGSSTSLLMASSTATPSTDTFERPAGTERTSHQDRLNAALGRLQTVSAWGRLLDKAAWVITSAFYGHLRGREHAAGVSPAHESDWRAALRELPPQQWYRGFIFGGERERVSAYNAWGAIGTGGFTHASPQLSKSTVWGRAGVHGRWSSCEALSITFWATSARQRRSSGCVRP